jgi:hypothetical protein
MQFSNPTNRALGLVQDVDFLCGTTSATYPLADKVRNINQAYMDVTRVIWDSADGWQYDDSNQTTLPFATTNLINNQQDYTLPSTAQRVQRVSIRDINGNYVPLRQIDVMDTIPDISQFPVSNTGGMPQYYDILGVSLMLYPTPISGTGGATLASGMKVYFDRDVILFTTASTTAAPGYASPFHRILAYSAAIDFTKDNTIMMRWAGERKALMDGLVRFYAHRNVERPSKMRPFLKKYRYTYR